MATVKWIRAIRGVDNRVRPEYNQEMRHMFDFFEEYRIKGPTPRSSEDWIVSLPRQGDLHLKDWFIPRTAMPEGGRYEWFFGPGGDKDALEEKAQGFLGRLCMEYGIPSFLTEKHNPSSMKLFLSPEAYIDEDIIRRCNLKGKSALDGLWNHLHHYFVEFLVREMAEALFQIKSVSQVTIDVFSSNGYSPHVDRCKLSYRICFPDIALDREGMKDARECFIAKLDAAWDILLEQSREEPDSHWTKIIEPIPRFTSNGSSADRRGSFWANTLREDTTRGMHHPLIYCDEASGDNGILAPESRPLKPSGRFHVTRDEQTGKAQVGEELRDGDAYAEWIQRGSVRTSKQVEPWPRTAAAHRASHPQAASVNAAQTVGGRPQAVQVTAARTNAAPVTASRVNTASSTAPVNAAPANTVQPTADSSETRFPPWRRYKSNDTNQWYYHNPATDSTVWEVWQECMDPSTNKKFYHHLTGDNETAWTCPMGAGMGRLRGSP